MADDLIDLDDGTWQGASRLAALYSDERAACLKNASRYHPDDPVRGQWERAAAAATDRCVEWSATAYERWIGSDDWAEWRESEARAIVRACRGN